MNKLMLALTATTPRTTTTTTPRTPESIVFNQYMRPPKGSIIKLWRDCFKQNRFGNDRNAHASKKAKEGAVRAIVESITDNQLSLEQRVLAISAAAVNSSDLRILLKSAGLVDQKEFNIYKYIFKNMRRVIKLAGETNHSNERTTDDLRSLFQSVILCTLFPSN